MLAKNVNIYSLPPTIVIISQFLAKALSSLHFKRKTYPHSVANAEGKDRDMSKFTESINSYWVLA